MKEEWRDISEFEGYYQISNLGRVRRIAEYSNQNSSWQIACPKILKPRLHNHGYLRVMLSIRGKHYDRYIHRLVAASFLNNPYAYKEINHIDGNKQNNQVTNLEWCNRSMNSKHAYKIGLRKVCGCYGQLKKKVAQIDINTKIILKIYETIELAASSTGITHSQVTNCCKGRNRTSKGYIWKYATDNMQVGNRVEATA